MKTICISSCLALSLFACAAAQTDSAATGAEAFTGPVSDAELGLDKNSVFDTPDPVLAKPLGGEPGTNQIADAYFSESPPAVPHTVESLLPITIDSNQCLDCHDARDQIGKEIAGGDPTPMPASHYTDLRRAPDKVTDDMIGARFNCNQCHVPMTDAKPLVVNTYK